MAIEIERKFLLDALPATVAGSGVAMRQGYLAHEGDVEVRVRITDSRASLTVKAGIGLTRTEVDVALAPDEAEALWTHTAGRRIDKVRHRVDIGAFTAEVDVYAGELVGLQVVEVEFPSEEEARRFDVPDWFGRELTGDAEWTNASLARNGRPRG